jgi:hypothetical protein
MTADEMRAKLEKPARRFERGGMIVEEYICEWDKPGEMKLLWVRAPLTMVHDAGGRANPFVHKDFPAGDAGAEAEARRMVQEAFDKYYGTPPGEREAEARRMVQEAFDKYYGTPPGERAEKF